MKETREISFAGSRFLGVLTHADVVEMLTEAGYALPGIPAGFNTVSIYFTTADKLQAMAMNQTGFVPVQSDNEREINGCTVVVCLDAKWERQRARYLLKALKNHLMERTP